MLSVQLRSCGTHVPAPLANENRDFCGLDGMRLGDAFENGDLLGEQGQVAIDRRGNVSGLDILCQGHSAQHYALVGFARGHAGNIEQNKIAVNRPGREAV